MKKTMLSLFGSFLLFIVVGNLYASTQVFSDATSYNTATGTQLFFIAFDNNPDGGTYANGNSFSADVTFGSPEAETGYKTQVWWNGGAITDAGRTAATNQVGPLNGAFTNPVYAFALDFSSAGVAETIYLYDVNSTLLASLTAPNASGFFGVLSSTPIKSFLLDNGTFPSGYADRFFIDNFRANAATVPIPAAVWLLGSGLLGLFGVRRKLRK